MENKARVLAYSMAKVIDQKELSDVSGGVVSWSHQETLKATGSSGNMEGFADVVVDW